MLLLLLLFIHSSLFLFQFKIAVTTATTATQSASLFDQQGSASASASGGRLDRAVPFSEQNLRYQPQCFMTKYQLLPMPRGILLCVLLLNDGQSTDQKVHLLKPSKFEMFDSKALLKKPWREIKSRDILRTKQLFSNPFMVTI